MWECAYYAMKCYNHVYQSRAEKWYKVATFEQKEDYAAYHNLSIIDGRRKEYQEALQTIEQALRLSPREFEQSRAKGTHPAGTSKRKMSRKDNDRELRTAKATTITGAAAQIGGGNNCCKSPSWGMWIIINKSILRTLKVSHYFFKQKSFSPEA